MISQQEEIFRSRNAELENELVKKKLELECKNRALEIEASLERVRAGAMSMHDSGDVGNATAVMFSELETLGIATLRCGIMIIDGSETIEVWTAGLTKEGKPTYSSGKLGRDIHPLHIEGFKAWKEKKSYYIYELAGEDLLNYFESVANAPLYNLRTNFDKTTKQFCSIFYFKEGGLFAFTSEPFPPETILVLEKFAGVFALTYRRYLDLVQAEAQAREAQIELALERVRARTMAMQRSEELSETVYILFQQFKELGENPDQATIGIVNEDEWVIEYWVTMYGNQMNGVFKFSIDEPNVTHRMYKAWKAKEKSLVIDLTGKELYDFTTYRAGMGGAAFNEAEKRRIINAAFFSKGLINVQSSDSRSAESIRLLERFAGVFDGTYTRFLDLKKAEAQTREAQIELGLERVRAKAMAMQTSEELNELIGTVFGELTKLHFVLTRCLIMIFDPETNSSRWWMANSEAPSEPMNYFVKNHKNDAYTAYLKAWKERVLKWQYELKGKVKKDWDNFLFVDTELSLLPDFVIAGMKAPERVLLSASFNNFGCLTLVSLEPLSEEHFDILLRFAKVFDMSYTRFNDLKQAEAQAQEAKIQLALERVRARTMAMQKSDELHEVIQLVFEQLHQLNFNIDIANFVLDYKESDDLNLWLAVSGQRYPTKIYIPYIDHPIFNHFNEAKEKGLDFFTDVLTFEEKNRFFKHLFENVPQVPEERKEAVFNSAGYARSVVFMKNIALTIQNYSAIPYSDAENATLMRFGKVFEQTYTRFNDLKQAEEQTREAKIEASLERIRSKTMAMHNSQDVADTVVAMFDELVKLGVQKTVRSGIAIIQSVEHMELWTASSNPNEEVALTKGHVNMTIHPLLQNFYNAWKNKEQRFSYKLTGNDLKDYYQALNKSPDYPVQFDIEKLPSKLFHNTFIFPEGAIFVFSPEPLTAGVVQIYTRFAGVFALTYRRYLDLQKAEEQAREAKIEASLERVRGKAMAMHNSADLTSTANMVFIELGKLGINPIRCGVGLLNKESRKALLYSATTAKDSDALSLIGWVVLSEHPVLATIYDSWLDNKNYFPVLNGEQLKTYYKILLSGFPVPSIPDWESGEKQYGHFLQFPEGCLYAWAEKPYTDAEIKILDRFKAIISLTFRRYIELQKLETNAREAVTQSSLDRVRAEIASMRSTNDLQKITPLIWNELTTLGVPFIRCGVFIVDEQQEQIHSYLSTPDGKAIATFQLPFNTEGIGQTVLTNWQKKQPVIVHWNEEEFKQLSHNLVEQGAVESEQKYLTDHPPTSLDLHFFPFLQGMLYAGNTKLLSVEEKDLVQSLADAFSTAYARYEDFNKLEVAKQQVENTLTELKAAQTKLIQSEKMASLGELTAGIAHEIQNPLNFVNNFSEVNQEMIDELEEELKSGNIEEALAIAADIKQNEKKINHHGKRADGIVKGMLQHSRSSTGDKQPTNINTLADEFMRLAYHGLRAKDKSFNAEMATHFDENLPKIDIVQQDIGRVLLNLFNNAFYAVNQKQKIAGGDYKPEVTVTTIAENNQVVIKVKDNGIGIPDNIKDKIMQPFFTSKPTGEGTGLGLSLTYDMVVKGHGGSIQVNSIEGEGSEFIIQLPNN